MVLILMGALVLGGALLWLRDAAGGWHEVALVRGAGAADAAAGAGHAGAGEAGGGATDSVVVHVAGAVKRPGVYTLPRTARVIDAISAAGGATESGRPGALNLAAVLSDGQRVYVPTATEVSAGAAASAPAAGRRGGGGGSGRSGPLPEWKKININEASAAELEALPGIGPSLAARIVEYRRKNGPFRSPEDLLKVPGIGEAKLGAVKDHIAVH